jgi:RimJ/RimL family protein N-acetyltransferase
MKISFGEYCIRSFELIDKAAIVKYANNYNVSKYLRERFPFPYTEMDAEEWLMFACNQDPEYNFAIADEKELIGGIGIHPQDDVYKFSCEIGYWIAEPFWGKGIAPSALLEMTKYTFTMFRFNRIFAAVFEGNKASEKVLLKAGYKLEAAMRKAVYKEGNFLDQYLYSMLREEFIK